MIQQPDLQMRWQQIKMSWKDLLFWFALLLTIVNWGIEALKWQWLLAPLESHSFLQSFKGVLAGCSITMLTPNRIGEFGGRVMFVQPKNRLKAISVTILGSVSQLAVTFILGALSILYFRITLQSSVMDKTFQWFTGNIVFIITLLGVFLLLMLFFNFQKLFIFLTRFVIFKKIVNSLSIVEVFTRKQLLRIFFLSFFRYLTFILQYIFLLKVMRVEIPLEKCFSLLALFYLIMAIAPTIGFTELPVRAGVGWLIIGVFSSNVVGIQAATFGIWLINIVLPAIIGSFVIIGLKFFKTKPII